jgi:hypothetical protein
MDRGHEELPQVVAGGRTAHHFATTVSVIKIVSGGNIRCQRKMQLNYPSVAKVCTSPL